ncbi:hypothetical protein [Paenibacillus silvisoli]|uniref:hypothetical protein n=1 Tax=Paenibacillus silvisoli TaxID=3110539 RepID=UPI0028058F73|nr:hypothetical protein [Paenibacillus silvisoli]
MPIAIPTLDVHPLDVLRQCRITRIECFRFDRKLSEELQHGDDSYICGLIAISTTTGIVGLKEFEIPCTSLKGDFTMWAAPFQRMKGMALLDSVDFTQQKRDIWGSVRMELIESALVNLNEQIGKPCVQFDRAYLFEHAQAYVSF